MMGHYSKEKCELCGKCLSECPVLEMDSETARASIRLLSEGKWVPGVLERCTGCMSCEAICPNGANPFGLLISHFSERYKKEGIPRIFESAMPQRKGPNIWKTSQKWFSADEKKNLSLWSKPPKGKEVLFLGCNQRLTPYIASTPIFEDIEIFTDPDECCGELYLRLGLFEEARKRASSLSRRLNELGIEKITAFCPACQNMMQNLSPNLLGVQFDFEVTGLVDWLLEWLERNQSRVQNQSKKVTVQDPCHASGLGENTARKVRDILERIGFTVVEMENCGLKAECCGLGASVSRYRIDDVAKTALRRVIQAKKTDAQITCAWCNGCYITMNIARLIYSITPPVFHLIELVELSSGGIPKRKMPARAFQLIAAGAESLTRDGFKLRREWL